MVFTTGNYRHGGTGTRLHNIWRDMLKRCGDLNNPKYGGRGISVCLGWQKFEAFRDWAYENGYHDGLTIERVNNEDHYRPGNCKWVTLKAQARNRRTTKWVTINGVTKSLAEWCEIYGMDYARVNARINKLGWGAERALTQRHR